MVEYSRPLGELDENPILRDVAFNRDSKRKPGQVSPLGQGHVDIGLDNIEVRLVQGLHEEDFKAVVGRGVRATIGVDPRHAEEDTLWEEMLKGGLQTALESQVVVFEVFGLSRALTHQLVRSRRAAFHQQSFRAAYMGAEPNVRMPESIWRNERARQAFTQAVIYARRAYQVACDEDISYQDARYALPIGTETYIVCEYPLREFMAVYAYRACSMFMHEMVFVMREMGRLLVEAHPWLEPHIKISCEKPQRCTYQGVERVEGQCDFPWAKEEMRTYKPRKELQIQ